jgi:endonuclease-3 related protein
MAPSEQESFTREPAAGAAFPVVGKAILMATLKKKAKRMYRIDGFAKIDLLKLYHELLKMYGSQGWWPHHQEKKRKGFDPQFEVMVGAVLTQNTSWKNVERAIQALFETHCLDLPAMTSIRMSKLESLIQPSGYFREKAKKLKLLATFLRAHPSPTREELITVWGVGPETADSILLYAFKKPFFVVDAYTRRWLRAHKRHTLAASDYEKIRVFFESRLPVSVPLYQEFHALIVRWAKDHR